MLRRTFNKIVGSILTLVFGPKPEGEPWLTPIPARLQPDDVDENEFGSQEYDCRSLLDDEPSDPGDQMVHATDLAILKREWGIDANVLATDHAPGQEIDGHVILTKSQDDGPIEYYALRAEDPRLKAFFDLKRELIGSA